MFSQGPGLLRYGSRCLHRGEANADFWGKWNMKNERNERRRNRPYALQRRHCCYFMTCFPAPVSSIVSRVHVITGRNSLQTVCLQWVTHQCTACHGWARTADRPAGRATIAKYTRCRWPDLTCLSMDVRDCIRYKNTLKHFIHLRSSSKRVTARFATWNIGNWQENQIEIRSKTLVNPSNIAHTRRTGSLAVSRSILYFEYRTHVPR